MPAGKVTGTNREVEAVVRFTGVPRAGRDQETPEWLKMIEEHSPRRGVPLSAQDLERGNDPPNESAEIRQSESEPRRVRATVQPPTEKTHGVIVEATYTTIGNTIRVRDLTGRLYVERFKPGDDLDHLARKLLRQHGPNSFYDPIAYPKSYH